MCISSGLLDYEIKSHEVSSVELVRECNYWECTDARDGRADGWFGGYSPSRTKGGASHQWRTSLTRQMLPPYDMLIFIQIYPCGAEFAMILSTPTDLATQWYGGISSSYHHEAGIVSLLLPRVKNTPQSTEVEGICVIMDLGIFVWTGWRGSSVMSLVSYVPCAILYDTR